MSFRLVGLVLVACLLAVVLPVVRKRSKQRPLRNIPGPPPASILTGIAARLHHSYAIPYREQVLTSYGRVVKLPWLLGDTQLAVSDPLALATLFGKYRDEFDLSEAISESFNTVFGPGLVAARGDVHTKQRKLLNVAFSPRVLREAVPIIHAVAEELAESLRKTAGFEFVEIELSEYLSRFALEAAGRATLGYSFGPLDQHGTDYSRALKRFGPTIARLAVWRPLLPWVKRTFPAWFLRAAVEVLPWQALRQMRAISDDVTQTARQILRRKLDILRGDDETSAEKGEGKDLMSVLLRQNMISASSGGDALSEDGLIGQMSALLLAATDTTSTSIVRAIQLLSERSEVQDKLRQELREATAGAGRRASDLDYDRLAGMPYLEAVIRETLRLYPAFYMSQRVSNKDAVLPLSEPIRGVDGELIHALAIPAGTGIWPNFFGANRDPAIWGADAAEWKPERWLSPLPDTVPAARLPSIFANLATFSAGPRSCIGYNLALTEMRIVLAHLLLAFEFAPSERAIVWKFGGVYVPSVEGSTASNPEFPVRMCSAQ